MGWSAKSILNQHATQTLQCMQVLLIHLLIVWYSSPDCTCNQCSLANVLKQLKDDFEFDDSKQELKEYDVAGGATGTVSDYRFESLLDCRSIKLPLKVAGSQIHLSCVEDEAVFGTDEKSAERIFVNCEPAESDKDDALSNIQLSLYLFNGVSGILINGVSTIYKR